MIKITVRGREAGILLDAYGWITVSGANNERELSSEIYSTVSNARRAAKTWHKRIPDSIIVDLTKKR